MPSPGSLARYPTNLLPRCKAHDLWLAKQELGRAFVEQRIDLHPQKTRTTKTNANANAKAKDDRGEEPEEDE